MVIDHKSRRRGLGTGVASRVCRRSAWFDDRAPDPLARLAVPRVKSFFPRSSAFAVPRAVAFCAPEGGLEMAATKTKPTAKLSLQIRERS